MLLDLREPEDYELFHINEGKRSFKSVAINFPAPNIGRDKIIPELFRFVRRVSEIEK